MKCGTSYNLLIYIFIILFSNINKINGLRDATCTKSYRYHKNEKVLDLPWIKESYEYAHTIGGAKKLGYRYKQKATVNLCVFTGDRIDLTDLTIKVCSEKQYEVDVGTPVSCHIGIGKRDSSIYGIASTYQFRDVIGLRAKDAKMIGTKPIIEWGGILSSTCTGFSLHLLFTIPKKLRAVLSKKDDEKDVSFIENEISKTKKAAKSKSKGKNKGKSKGKGKDKKTNTKISKIEKELTSSPSFKVYLTDMIKNISTIIAKKEAVKVASGVFDPHGDRNTPESILNWRRHIKDINLRALNCFAIKQLQPEEKSDNTAALLNFAMSFLSMIPIPGLTAAIESTKFLGKLGKWLADNHAAVLGSIISFSAELSFDKVRLTEEREWLQFLTTVNAISEIESNCGDLSNDKSTDCIVKTYVSQTVIPEGKAKYFLSLKAIKCSDNFDYDTMISIRVNGNKFNGKFSGRMDKNADYFLDTDRVEKACADGVFHFREYEFDPADGVCISFDMRRWWQSVFANDVHSTVPKTHLIEKCYKFKSISKAQSIEIKFSGLTSKTFVFSFLMAIEPFEKPKVPIVDSIGPMPDEPMFGPPAPVVGSTKKVKGKTTTKRGAKRKKNKNINKKGKKTKNSKKTKKKKSSKKPLSLITTTKNNKRITFHKRISKRVADKKDKLSKQKLKSILCSFKCEAAGVRKLAGCKPLKKSKQSKETKKKNNKTKKKSNKTKKKSNKTKKKSNKTKKKSKKGSNKKSSLIEVNTYDIKTSKASKKKKAKTSKKKKTKTPKRKKLKRSKPLTAKERLERLKRRASKLEYIKQCQKGLELYNGKKIESKSKNTNSKKVKKTLKKTF